MRPAKFATLVPVLQTSCISAPQFPLYKFIAIDAAAGVIFKREIRCTALVAVKENHISSFVPVLEQVGNGVFKDCVAFMVVCPVEIIPQLKSGFAVNGVAFKQSSFGGGILAVTHIPKVPTSPPCPYILT